MVKLAKSQRFGSPNLRHSLESFLVAKNKTDVKTARAACGTRRAQPCSTMYVQTDIDELIAAQEMMLNAIFSHAEARVN